MTPRWLGLVRRAAGMLAAVVLAAAMCLAASGCAEVNVNLGDPNGQASGKPAHTYQYKWP